MFVLSKLGRVALVMVATAGVVLPAAPVAAAKTICVGLVVDARTLGGPLSADCTKVPDGSTGYDVLKAAGHTVGFRQDGLICTIDNRPADGCADVDAMHYWAYFHREPHESSWTYSNEGATTYEPENGETEGWVWRDGGMAKPENVPYSTICPQTASPHPRATTTEPTAQPHATSTAAQPQPAPSTTTTAASPSSQPAHRSHHRSPPATADSTTEATATTSPTAVAAVTTPHDGGSSGPPWGLLLGLAVVLGLGGAATWQWRRRTAE